MGLFRRRAGGKGSSSSNDKNEPKNKNIAPAALHESQPLNPRQPLGSNEHHVVDETTDLPEIDEEIAQKARIVMKDHLSIMRDIVMKIRHEDGYAKAMYSNCPRLQHLLDRNPDLRPVFEDPRLVRINFETVYKESGGILPEDEEAEEKRRKNPSLLVRITNSKLFKFLKLLFFIKKIIGCIAGGGIAIVASFWSCCTNCCIDCCCEDALEEIGEIDEEEGFDNDGDGDMPILDENQIALNSAADYMEDPEVQEQMQRLLEDPENLEDAIENDTELRTLRDSNPLCAELMQDPETMKILVDPDNLRALGEAPKMIELDFTDPTGFTPEADFVDIEAGNLEGLDAGGDGVDGGGGSGAIDDPFLNASGSIDGMSMDGLEAYEADLDKNEMLFEMDDDDDIFDYEDDGSVASGESYGESTGGSLDDGSTGDSITGFDDEAELDAELEAEAEAAPASGWEDDVELEQQDVNADGNDVTAGKGKNNNKQQQKQTANGTEKKGMSGLVASFGVAATDIIASQIVGAIFEDIPVVTEFLGGGGGGPFGGLEVMADNANDLVVLDQNLEDIAEDAMDEVEDGDSDDDGDKEKDTKKGRQNNVDGRKFDASGRNISVLMGATTIDDDDENEDDDGLDSINSNEDEEFIDEDDGNEDEDDDENKDAKPSSKLFGAIKKVGVATVTTFKETLVSTVLGDDLAEMLVEKQEERAEARAEAKAKKKAAESASDGDSDSNDSDSDGKKKKKSLRKKFGSFLGRKRDDDEIEKKASGEP
jgi:hypothetical protein